MPLSNNLKAFAKATGLSLSLTRQLVCTAEHLKAKSEGGRDTSDNIVAACLVCNQRRHKRKTPPDPSRYKALVTQRLHKGKWHVAPVFTSLLVSPPDAAQRRHSEVADGIRLERPVNTQFALVLPSKEMVPVTLKPGESPSRKRE